MTYGLSASLFVENGPAIQAARALHARSSRDALLVRPQAELKPGAAPAKH